jgi:hypothetical protein
MPELTRRSFTSGAAACLAALGAAPALAATPDPTATPAPAATPNPAATPHIAAPARAQVLWSSQQWDLAAFAALTHAKARAKLIYNITEVEDGGSLQSIRATLNGLHYGFGVPHDQITIVAALHGQANLLNYADAMWSKYAVGERLGIKDPETGLPAIRNPYAPSRFTPEAALAAAATDPNDPASPLNDATVEGLQRRGVRFLSCHAGLEGTVRQMVKQFHTQEDPEAIVRDMVAHKLPGVLVVASISAAMTLLQSEGGYGLLNA